MSGRKTAAVASALLIMGGSAAWAQTANWNSATQNNANSGAQSDWGQSSPGGRITADTQQKIRQSLEQSGFKDVRVIPESFVVRAQAPDGSRIVMLLSPDELTGLVMPNASQAMQGNNSLPSGQYSSQAGNGAGTSTTQNQAQQELSRYGYTNVQDVVPMRGWVAEATKNGEQVRVLLSDNGLVATFPGR